MTPEGKVKTLIDRLLTTLRDKNFVQLYWHKPVMNGMGAPTLDYIGCMNGLYFSIEAKAPGKKPTPIQEKTMSQIKSAGGRTFVIDSDESLAAFRNWAMLEA